MKGFPNNNSGNYHSNAQQPVGDQNGVGANSSQQIQNNSAYSGAQASNQQPVVDNDHTDQRINEALNSFLAYIKQLDQKMTHMEAQYNQCIQMHQIFWGPQQMRWFPPTDEPSGIQFSLVTSNMYNFILMNIAHLLCDSFRDKSKVKFIGDLTNDNTLFVGLTETFLNSNILDSEILMEGFNIVRCDRSERMGGGVCFYLKQSINHKTLLSYCNSIGEVLIVKLSEPDWSILN